MYKINKISIIFGLLFFLQIPRVFAVIIASATSGSFNLATTWVGGIVPAAADTIIIANTHTVTLTGSRTINNITINAGGVFDNAGFTVNMQEVISGWGASATINGEYTGGGLTIWQFSQTGLTGNHIDGTGIVSTTGYWEFGIYVNTIAATANLTFVNSDFHIGILALSNMGYLTNNGTITLVNGSIITPNAASQFNNYGNCTLTNGSINLGNFAALSNWGTIWVGMDINLVTRAAVGNSGTITVLGNVTGTHATFSRWTNNANSTLNIAGSMLATGTLNANASGNTVNYNGAVNQSIKYPSSGIYWHLTNSNAGTKTIVFTTFLAIQIRGNFTIQNMAQFDSGLMGNMQVKGNWINTSTNADPFIEQITQVYFNGTAAQSITANLTGGETFWNLSIFNSSTGVTQVNNNVNVNGILNLTTGLLHTGIYETNVTNNALTAITNYSTASYVDGFLRRSLLNTGGAYDFPVGNSTAYELATVNFTAAHTVGSLLVNFSNLTAGTGLPLSELGNTFSNVLNCGGTAAGIGNANDGVWTITPNSGTANYDLTLNARNYSNAALNSTILKRVNASSPWTLLGNYVVASGSEPRIVTRTGYTGFSQFAIGESSIIILPIELISFESTCLNNNIINLHWATATETNNYIFTIERSNDAVNFNAIATQHGTGNSTKINQYSYADKIQEAGNYYYRLKQTDFDGKNKIVSSIISSNCYTNESVQTVLFPNPVKDNLTVSFTSKHNQTLNLKITDVLGNVIIENNISYSADSRDFIELKMESFPTGIYYINVKSNETDYKSKFIKQ